MPMMSPSARAIATWLCVLAFVGQIIVGDFELIAGRRANTLPGQYEHHLRERWGPEDQSRLESRGAIEWMIVS